MLAAAGPWLVRAFDDGPRHALGRQILARALELDPSMAETRRLLAAQERNDASMVRRRALRMTQANLAGRDILEKVQAGQPLSEDEQRRLTAREYDAVVSLPESDRLGALARLATGAYLRAEYLQHVGKDTQSSWDVSKRAADEALQLASRLPDHPDYGMSVYDANLALGAHLLRAGDRQGAVRHLIEASKAPPSEALALGVVGGLDGKLVNYLLKAGERESVADFLERSAELRTFDRDRLLQDAVAIREGRMPRSYQYMLAREQPK